MTGGKKRCTPKEVKWNAKVYALQSRQFGKSKEHGIPHQRRYKRHSRLLDYADLQITLARTH